MTLRNAYDWLPHARPPITPQNYQWRRSGFVGVSKFSSPQFRMILTPSSWERVEQLIPFLNEIPEQVSRNSVAIGCGLYLEPDDDSSKRPPKIMPRNLSSIHIFYQDTNKISCYVVPISNITIEQSGLKPLDHIWANDVLMERYVIKRLAEQDEAIRLHGVDRLESYIFPTHSHSKNTTLDKVGLILDYADVVKDISWQIFRVFDYNDVIKEAKRRIECISSSFDEMKTREYNDYKWLSDDSVVEADQNECVIDTKSTYWTLFSTDGYHTRVLHEDKWFKIDVLSSNLDYLMKGYFSNRVPNGDVDRLLLDSRAELSNLLHHLRSDAALAQTAKMLATYASEE